MSDKAITDLADSSHEFSGAEIEQVVTNAMYSNYAPGKKLKLTKDQVMRALNSVTPLARSRAEDLKHFRSWAQSNATHASDPEKSDRGQLEGTPIGVAPPTALL